MVDNNGSIGIELLCYDDMNCDERKGRGRRGRGCSEEGISAELEASDEQPGFGLTEEEKFWWNSPNNVDKGDE